MSPELKTALKKVSKEESLEISTLDKYGRPIRYMQKKILVMGGGGKPKVEKKSFMNPPHQKNRHQRRVEERTIRRDGAPDPKTRGAFGKRKII